MEKGAIRWEFKDKAKAKDFQLDKKKKQDYHQAGFTDIERMEKLLRKDIQTSIAARSSFATIYKISQDFIKVTIYNRDALEIRIEDFSYQQKLIEKVRKLTQEKKHYDLLIDHFLKSLSHEIRTPANGILGFTQIMETSCRDSENLDMLGMIRKSANRLIDVMTDLVDIARLRSGDYPITKSFFPLIELLEEVLHDDELKEKMDKQNVSCHPGDFNKAIEIKADYDALKKIVYKLVDNAIKYSEGESVTIDAKQDAEHVTLIFSDTGIGMENTNEIHDIFKQASLGKNKINEGLGLGLSISRLITELHGGHLDVKSAAGEGTNVTVSLPVR